MAFHAAPLPHEWMIGSIIGFFVSLFLIYGTYGHQGMSTDIIFQQWGAAFMAVFLMMFGASIISMTTATTDPEHLDVLAVHYRRR
jgi:hypothetical protein